MIVPALEMAIYRDRLAHVSKKAADEVQKYMLDHGFNITEEFLDYAEAVVSKYGEAAGALSAQFYDDIAEYWTDVENRRRVKTIKAAEAAEVPSTEEIRKTVYGTLKDSAEKIPGALSRLVKRTAEDTTLHNAIRDGAEFAWVPAGDTCAFCIMLASRGWQRASKKALKGGHAEHIHANCDCTYTIRFDKKSGVEGYDPDRYLQMYENTNGGTWQQRVNDMRREMYAADPEKYRAQKRAAYAKKNERLSEEKTNDTINKKFVDRVSSFYESNETAYSAEEIDEAMTSSPIGAEAAEYISENGYSVSLYYGDFGDYAGEIYGKDIYVYPYNNKDAREISGTIIHEMCHTRYGWNRTMEDEVNCRLMEIMHLNGNVSKQEIREIVRTVRRLYPESPEGNLYGF